jgi:two-component sensor histidine kinase
MADEPEQADDWPVALLRVDRTRRVVIHANDAARRLLAWSVVSPGQGLQPELQPLTSPGSLSAPQWLWGLDSPPPGWEPLVQAITMAPEGAALGLPWPRLVEGQPQMWHITSRAHGAQVRLVCVDAGAAVQAAAPDPHSLMGRGNVLVREVHHRLKNNLQGVSGLLRHQAALHPAAAPHLESAAAQLQAMAQVYGLQLPDGHAPECIGLVQAVARAVGAVFGVEPEVREVASAWDVDASSTQSLRSTLWAHLGDASEQALPQPGPLRLHPDQAGSLALVLNELMTNALKHGAASAPGRGDAGVRPPRLVCEVRHTPDGAEVDICNPGQWDGPPRLDDRPPGVQGLGLVRALLPSRGADLQFITQPGWVCARLQIRPPVLVQLAEPAPQSSTTANAFDR